MSDSEGLPGEFFDPLSLTPALSREIDWAAIKKLPLDPEAEMSHEAWLQLVGAVEGFNQDRNAAARLDIPGGDYDAQLEYPLISGDPTVNLNFAKWLRSDTTVDGRSVTHMDLDLRRPGVLIAREVEISYPDKNSVNTSFEGRLIEKDEHPTAYVSTSGDTIGYLERTYAVNEAGVQSISALLAGAREIEGEDPDKAFEAVFESLEPGLREACERFYFKGKSLVFDPESEFKTEWAVISDPFRNVGTALIGSVPGRVELYIARGFGFNRPSAEDPRNWTKLIWQKENVPDRFYLQEHEPDEVTGLTLEEILEVLPAEQHEYIREQEESYLRGLWMIMQTDHRGNRGVSPARQPKVRQDYAARYQQYVAVFPNSDINLSPELPE